MKTMLLTILILFLFSGLGCLIQWLNFCIIPRLKDGIEKRKK